MTTQSRTSVAPIPDPITIVLAESHGVIRGALRRLLEAEPGFEIAAEAVELDAGVRKVLGYKPDVVIIDEPVGIDALLEALPRFAAASPDTAVVLLTEVDDPGFARTMIRHGARAVVLKQGAENDLADAVRAAAAGHAYLNPQVGVRIAVEEERTNGRAAHLTGRELEVLRMVALGYTNPEMARQLGISVRTVEAHRSHLRSKIDVTTRAEFSAYARARHIV